MSKALAVLLLLLLTPFTMAQSDDHDIAPPSLTVSGSGELWVEPDEARVRLGVEAQEPEAQQAQDQVSRAAAAILESLVTLGVPREQIQTAELRLTPVYSRTDPRSAEAQEARIIAYQASNVVSVRLDELALVGPVIDAGLAAGANRLEGVSFSLQDDLPLRKRALQAAVREARAKAEAMAEALEVTLVAVQEVREGGVSIVTPRFAEARMMTAQVSAAATPVASGQIQITANVTLRYRIAPTTRP